MRHYAHSFLPSRLGVLLVLQTVLLLLFGTTTTSSGAPVSATAIWTRHHNNNNNKHSLGPTKRKTLAAKTVPTKTTTSKTTTTTKLSSSSSSPAAWLDGLKNGLASAMAAACVKTVLQPIDAIKTIQQYHIAQTTATSAGASLNLVQACRQIMQAPGGVGNFYAGLGVTVLGAMPGVALYFGVYSYCKQLLLPPLNNHNHNSNHNHNNSYSYSYYKTASIALSAAIGNSVASFSRVPYEVLKQKLQTKAYSSTWEAFEALAASGPNAWWRILFPRGGVAIQMIRDVPYAVCTLLLYEYLKSWSASRRNKGGGVVGGEGVNYDKAWDFALGGIAGGVGSWVTTPMDVVKTRLQTDPDLYDGSVWKCTHALWVEGGARAFLRGAVPRLMHKVPANAFFFLFYEAFRKLLHVHDAPV